jgi:Zn-dependent protease with chaperone function
MRTSKAVVAAILFLGIQLGMAESRHVTICMDAGLFFTPIEHRARYEATRIFSKIDVDLHWVGRRDCPDGAIQILQNPTPPPEVAPSALACAYPFNRSSRVIVLFRKRVDNMLNGRGTAAGVILGHILAHEIGHMLIGTDVHSSTGLMKPGWTNIDIGAMLASKLEFSPLHSEMIRNNLIASRLN